jgi:misacylated tRNA(Ala) deacylase
VQPTIRLDLDDDHCYEADAVVLDVQDGAIAFDRSCFHPGGGGQPPDSGSVRLDGGATLAITGVRVDDRDVLWHLATGPVPRNAIGRPARLLLDRERRVAIARYHTVLHVLNTTALREYGGLITGVQIGTTYSRIDFKLEGFSAALGADLERKVNAVLATARALRSYYIPEGEFRRRADLLRTLDARPPIRDGRVRVVAIDGFDEQACGGSHVASTAEVGRFSIFRTENKGRLNKRLYVRLER